MFAFFWFAIFPMILGGILLAIFIFILKKEAKKPANSESKRITPAKFINEVAQYSNIDNAEAEKIIKFVFSYFPEFNWRKNLPRVRDDKLYEGNEKKAKKSEGKAENKKTQG
ncbi:MAG TPA: hypothetical protein VLK23_14025 [Thermodesulfobacteriota bacterium]|nr:hypothetical protein [Thermodesulfobacteriota bacterium]